MKYGWYILHLTLIISKSKKVSKEEDAWILSDLLSFVRGTHILRK